MNRKLIRQLEKQSILDFLINNTQFLEGNVLDYGCGEEPYMYLVSGQYTAYDPAYDSKRESPIGPYTSILCTQVLEYIERPDRLLRDFHLLLAQGGHLVMTYPTHWEEVEGNDYLRFTRTGMERLLQSAGFGIVRHEERLSLPFDDFKLVVGYGVVAKKL